jgi:hypothetical protein
MICPKCGGEFKNLGVHTRFCKDSTITVDDYIKEKLLSSIISGIEDILRSVQHQLQVSVTSDNGKESEVELKVRFQIRR